MLSEAEMFEVYKRRIMTEGLRLGEVRRVTRYNVIQYLCSFPHIDPDDMAAAIIREDAEVKFDDSSINATDNAKHRRRVMRIVREMEEAETKQAAYMDI